MNVDGRAIADLIKEDLKTSIEGSEKKYSLIVLVSTDDMTTNKFLEIKRKFGDDIGVQVDQIQIGNSRTQDVVEKIKSLINKYDGVIVQFPLKEEVDSREIRNSVPVNHDVDVISDVAIEKFKTSGHNILPPVVGAIAEIIHKYEVEIKEKNVVIVGRGRLVGAPSMTWFKNKGGNVTVVDKDTTQISNYTKEADILVLGAGIPGLILPDMIKEGVILFDAGTSEDGGKLRGDADPLCAEKARIFTPVPGGIGPITVAIIFKNLLILQGIVK